MITRATLLAVTIAMILAGSALAGAKLDFQLTPSIAMQSGYHDYEIKFAYYDVVGVDTAVVSARSKLEFPLDGIYPSLKAGLNNRFESEGLYFAEAEASINVTDPDDVMKDSDWDTRPSSEEILWSYSESSVEHTYLMLQGLIGRKITKSQKALLGVVLGFRYVKIKQDIVGLDLRQLIDGSWASYTLDGKVGYYEVEYKMPFIGARLIYRPSPTLELMPQMLLSRLFVSDFDDHILRGKTAEASPTGIALIGDFAGRYQLKSNGKSAPFIELSGELRYLHATGKQVQTWYKDEPLEGGSVIEAGTKISNIPHEINNTSFSVGLGVGINF